jgi:hypothetical protein
MKIARNPAMKSSNNVARLPAAWGTLVEIARMEPDEIEAVIAADEITPQTTRARVLTLVRERKAPAETAEPPDGVRDVDPDGDHDGDHDGDLLARSRALAKELRAVRRLWAMRVPRERNHGLDVALRDAVTAFNRALTKMAPRGDE